MIGTVNDPGILPRFCDDIMYDTNEYNDEVLIEASFFEIYNEQVVLFYKDFDFRFTIYYRTTESLYAFAA